MKTTRLAPVLLCLALGAALLAFLPLISAASSLSWRAQPEAASSAPDWAALLDASTLVVRGQVVATQSQWDTTHTAIESRHTVAVRYALLGAAPAQVQVRTPGGIVAAEGIGMFETAAPTLTDEEEVLLFLAPGEEGYVIAGGDGGKYTVEAGRLVNRRTLFAGAQAESYAALAATDARVTLPADWAAQEVAVGSETVVGGLDFVYNNLKWFTDTVDYRVNVNSVRADGDNGSRDDFLLAIRSAAERWTLVEEADFSLVYAGASESIDIGYNNANEVLFIDKGITDANGRNMPLAVARVFFMEADLRIVEADIWVNDAFAWDATGEPSGLEPDLQTVLTHEFGHWLALGHDADSRAVMFPTVMLGTTKRALYDNDRRGILFIYPCLTGEGACNPAPTATPTPTITPTPTPTLTPTPTATPTATPVPAGRTFAPHAGGVLTYTTSAGTAISLSVPAEAFAVTTTLAIEHAGVVGNPPQTEQRAVECFVVKFQEAGEASGPPPGVASFTVPMSLTVAYGEAALAGLDEATLVFYVYDVADEAWVEAGCGAAAYDAPANRVDVPICAPDTYGLFAARLPSVYLPAIRRD